MALTNKQKRDWAQTLYTKEHLLQREIAAKVDVSPITISRWVKRYHWDDLRASLSATKEQQLSNLYTQLKEINEAIASREERRYPDAKEADTIVKLTGAINALEEDVGLSETLSAFHSFLEWTRSTEPDKAQEISLMMDDYVKHKLALA